ncbi:hypothetical protein HDZ31DRAFT_44895 [Schizophyllum fasciatum]
MTSAGEKQYYAVALMDALMENLPEDWRVGVLYDIACQMHASAVRYGIFNKYLHRLQFAVSIFHAFGHDWPCQIIYHPRKCIGFGLTDGEGCERFWYSISKLIPYLRVAGYHLRLYTINGQVAFATKEAAAHMGAWLSRKARNLEGKRSEALRAIKDAGEAARNPAVVREEWAAQKEVARALQLLDEIQEAEKAVERLRTASEARELDHTSQAELQLAEANLLATQARYDRKEAELGVSGRRQLRRLKKSKLLHLRASGLVLLRRIQVGIVKRKMEVERVVRSHQNKHGEKRLQKHIKTAAERREGTVKTTVRKYNQLCRELAALIKRRARRAACSIRPLSELPPSGFWDLDIDNPCWDDLRFDAHDSAQAPRWMADDDMRQAIRGQLLLDRCAEEAARLAHERENALDWYESEWLAVHAAQERALRHPDAPALLHQLKNRRRHLLRVAVQWRHHGLDVRGPSEENITLAEEEWAQASCDYNPHRDIAASVPELTRADDFTARTTRSGKAFTNYIPVVADVDLKTLFEIADRGQADENEPESDIESDTAPELSAPSSRASSPLPDLTETEDEGGDPSNAEMPSSLPRPHQSSKSRKSARQRKKRRAEQGNSGESSKRHRAEKIISADTLPTPFNLAGAAVTSTGWAARRDDGEVGVPALRALQNEGFQIVNWCGRVPTAFTCGREQTIIAVALGMPDGEGFEEDHLLLADELEDARGRMTFAPDQRCHRRGNFFVKAHGTSFGGGQQEPRPLKHSAQNRRELDRLTQLRPMQRIAHFGSGGFANWQPKVHTYYSDVQNRLLGWKPHLRRRRPFKKSVWSCLSINFGPRTLCNPHRDFGNLSFGFCTITALGRFNADLGGHLVLRELKLAIRFPAGSTILIPSALITHYNIEIAPSETRYSVTQYTAGAIFRFVAHGFRLDEEYYGSLDAEGQRLAKRENAGRWRWGMAKLSRLPELKREAGLI